MNKFQQPYPSFNDWLENLLTAIIIGLFVPLFLLVFQPFGLSEWNTGNKYLIVWGYGLTCFLILLFTIVILPAIYPEIFKEEKWTIGREVSKILIHFIVIGIGIMVYSDLVGLGKISIKGIFSGIFYAVIIGVFPVSLFTFLNYTRLIKRHLRKAHEINNMEKAIPKKTGATGSEADSSGAITLFSANGKEKIQLYLATLLFIKTLDNYCEIIYLKDKEVKRILIRSTLKSIEEQVNHTLLIRSHQSFLINLFHFKNIKGNAQGYKLYLCNWDDALPVSRSASKKVLETIGSIHK